MHSASSHLAQTPIPDAPLQTDSSDDPIQQPSTHSCTKFNTHIALAKGCACPDGYAELTSELISWQHSFLASTRDLHEVHDLVSETVDASLLNHGQVTPLRSEPP